jgi:hypothetical protein
MHKKMSTRCVHPTVVKVDVIIAVHNAQDTIEGKLRKQLLPTLRAK